MIFFEAIILALSTPSRRILSKYDLSSNNFLISVEIGSILSTRTSDNFCLNSEKFLPVKFSTLFSKVEFAPFITEVQSDYKKNKRDSINLLLSS